LNKYRKKSIDNTYIIKLGTNKQYHNNYCKYIQNNKIHILTVGGIVPHKNQLLIAKAGKLLKMRGINYEWKIIGPIRNYRYYDRVINYIKENNLDQNITLVTKADDLYIDQSYQSANIYVQPSKEEGFCIAALDAAMYGIPIIGTDVGEIANLVNMTNGILVKTNEEDIAKAVEKIIKRANINGDYKNALSREYSWQTNVNNLMRLYQNSLSETTDK
jgi:glycosyltransferase involved in cell wall biosynthesis